MFWMQWFVVTIGAGALSTFSDWFFAGDWIHKRWTYPEVWRRGSEGRAIALTSPLPFLTCGIFALVAYHLGLDSVRSTVKLAAVIWVIGPLPLILTNAAFLKLHRAFVFFYSLGWLVKLEIAAVVTAKFLR